MIKIVAKLLVKADKVWEFKKSARELVTKSRQEEGNVFYSLNVSTDDPRRMAFIECWKDQAAIDFHNRTEHFTGILPGLMEMCEEPPVAELYEEVEY